MTSESTTERPRPGQLTFTAPRRGKPPRHLADLSLAERVELVEAMGHKGFRAKQLSVHYFDRLTTAPEEMTDLPASVRERLVADLLPRLLTEVRTLSADQGATLKSVWRLHDGALVESVLMRYPRRVTLCISSQAGCGMNCPFCATGQSGLTRNLSTAEIVEQVVDANRRLRSGALSRVGPVPVDVPGVAELGDESDADDPVPVHGIAADAASGRRVAGDHRTGADHRAGGGGRATGDLRPADGASQDPARVTNIVFMGMGEALANYRATIGAIRRLIDPSPAGLGMSARGLTMSTVGLVPGIDRLTAEGIPVTLALSLHAPDDELRDELVPINTRWKVAEALDAAHRYFEATGRRVSIEYALIRDINDHAWRADLLGELLNARGRGWVHVNPIPLNPTPGSKWTASRPGVQQQFVERLRAHGIPTTVRDTRGSDIDGACGQLAASTADGARA